MSTFEDCLSGVKICPQVTKCVQGGGETQLLRIIKTTALVTILISPGFSWRVRECDGQNKIAPSEYDYYSLAITSVLNSGAEATKLPNVPQRVRLLIYAAKILPASEHDEAVRLLDIALRHVKEWESEDKASWRQRNTAATLRNEVLAVYAVLDSEKAMGLQKEFQDETKSSTSSSRAASSKKNDWFTQFSDQRAIADQSAKIALSLIDADPEKALALVVKSLQGGIVSNVLYEIVQKLLKNGNRASLNRLESAIGESLAASATFDPFSLSSSSTLILADKDMSAAAARTLVNFLIRSLQAQSNLAREPMEKESLGPSYARAVYTLALLNVRPVVLQYSPEQLLAFDLVLDQIAPLVPVETRTRLQAFQPETFSDPRERLNDILKDPIPDKRDLRLVRFLADLLRNDSDGIQKHFEVAADAISGFTDPEAKAAYTDRLTITRIDTLVKQKEFIEAQELASLISGIETRAWALLALSTIAAKTDRVLGFELISNALKVLDKASPSPHKVELALIAAGMLANSDPRRAFETLSAASKYANSSPSKIDSPAKPPFAFGLEAKIGEASTRLGVFPESLGELKVDHSVSTLAVKDWFRADQIVNEIREPSLRLKLKLQMAEAVIAKGSEKIAHVPTAQQFCATAIPFRKSPPALKVRIKESSVIRRRGLAKLVKRAEAGETFIAEAGEHIIDANGFSETSEIGHRDSSPEKIEALAQMICRSGEESSAALFVLMAALQDATDPQALAHSLKHFAFTRCGEFNFGDG